MEQMENAKKEDVRQELIDVVLKASGGETLFDFICKKYGVEKPQAEWVKGEATQPDVWPPFTR